MSRGFKRPRSLAEGGMHRWALVAIILVAVVFRFWRLNTLPPGLAPGEAMIALAGHAFVHGGVMPDFGAADGQSPLLVAVAGLAQLLFGMSPWIMRVVPALSGVFAVGAVYLLARDLLNRRSGLVAAALVAACPWAVTLNRTISAAALVPFALALTLLLGLRWWRRRGGLNLSFIALIAIFDLLLGPAGWAVLFVAAVAAATAILSGRIHGLRGSVTAAVAIVGVIIPAIVLYLFDHQRLGVARTAHELGHASGQTLMAFLFHGDDGYQYNLGGQPLLNIFIGIMMIAGILVVATRFNQARYRILVATVVASLVPSMVTIAGTPSAGRLGLALVPVMMLACVGIGYMLEIWYSTFPINSAARLTGQSAIVILLALSGVQGYNQYFIAWAQSSPTYGAYSERALAMATWANRQPVGSRPVLVIEPIDRSVVAYGLLSGKNPTTTLIAGPNLTPTLATRPLRLGISAPSRDLIIGQLRQSAAGGRLVPHLSLFDQSELFYSYEVR